MYKAKSDAEHNYCDPKEAIDAIGWNLVFALKDVIETLREKFHFFKKQLDQTKLSFTNCCAHLYELLLVIRMLRIQ